MTALLTAPAFQFLISVVKYTGDKPVKASSFNKLWQKWKKFGNPLWKVVKILIVDKSWLLSLRSDEVVVAHNGGDAAGIAHPICLTVVFSRHLKRWWCCSSKTSSLKLSSIGKPAALAAILASAAFFLDTKAAPVVAFAICMRASRAFCKMKESQRASSHKTGWTL